MDPGKPKFYVKKFSPLSGFLVITSISFLFPRFFLMNPLLSLLGFIDKRQIAVIFMCLGVYLRVGGEDRILVLCG